MMKRRSAKPRRAVFAGKPYVELRRIFRQEVRSLSDRLAEERAASARYVSELKSDLAVTRAAVETQSRIIAHPWRLLLSRPRALLRRALIKEGF